MKYYIIAGEASGDLHGSNLMKGIYAEDPEAVIRFWGGDLMDEVCRTCGRAGKTEGEGLVHHYREDAIMGFWEILTHGRRLLRNVSECRKDILRWKPDVVILIDYPGFNFKIAAFSHSHGIRTFYYIAPKVWASREGRIRKLKEYVDRLYIVFPFEIPKQSFKGSIVRKQVQSFRDGQAVAGPDQDSVCFFEFFCNRFPIHPVRSLLSFYVCRDGSLLPEGG